MPIRRGESPACLLQPERIRDIPFSPTYFHYDTPIVFSGHEDFAGFKVFAPGNRPGVQDELLSFLGGSYFRAIGRGSHWGLSARGVAVNTGIATPKEFPDFREFWIRQPQPAVQFTPTDQGWLVSFTIFNPNKAPTAMDVSCVILRRDSFCSEKWQYLLHT